MLSPAAPGLGAILCKRLTGQWRNQKIKRKELKASGRWEADWGEGKDNIGNSSLYPKRRGGGLKEIGTDARTLDGGWTLMTE